MSHLPARESPGESIFIRYAEHQRYVGWSAEDADCIRAVAAAMEPEFPQIIEDFYRELASHPGAWKVITGGPDQVRRLRETLLGWLAELFAGPYDARYVERRWRVGLRHAEIGLDPVYCNLAMSRIRSHLIRTLERGWGGDLSGLTRTIVALGKLLDLDLAVIEGAYQAEYLARQQHVERLATIGQVAGGVAHELRNPLNVVKTSVYYLLNARNPTPEKRREHFSRIERHVELADGVITALSNFAKLPIPDPRPFSLAMCIEETLSLNPAPPGVTVVREGLEALPPAAGDPKQIHIVVGNIVRNACEAMAGQGTLTIRGSVEVEGRRLAVAFADTGPGIANEQLARVMEPFYTTKARGLGLGLAISRSIAEKNQGEIRAASEPGKGSTFVLRLNASSAPWSGEMPDRESLRHDPASQGTDDPRRR